MLSRQYINHSGKKVPLIYGAKGGCFPAETLISMWDDTEKLIKDISVGDMVKAFTKTGKLVAGTVTETFLHPDDEFIKLEHWQGELVLTPNHWVLCEDGLFDQAGNRQEDHALITEKGKISPITKIIKSYDRGASYNFTVKEHHTFIADGIRVHNKGGGKGGGGTAASGTESPNSLFSTDILFVTTALGEGPIYRINPNGPQDIEINEGNVDDLININGDGQENNDVFKTGTTTGTTTQAALDVFGEQAVTPQNFSSSVILKKGNIAGVPQNKILLQSTSANDWDALKFLFLCNTLQESKNNGDIVGQTVDIKITVFNNTGETQITSVERSVSGKTNTPFKFSINVPIPAASRNSAGYKFTIEKTNDDSDSSRVQQDVRSLGWFEIENRPQTYPRTAMVGYALKAFAEHTGGVPTFTSLVKGLLVKVPSNYNQPVLASGEIDWREIEVPESGTNSYVTNGYRLQNAPTTVQTTINPQIYIGTWDGTFIYNWTQNPVWIIYDILTNKTYGLAVPEEHIDKFQFFKVAQFCDACNSITGKFEGVNGLADGTFRHKPRTKFSTVKQNQIGLSSSTQIKERRFIFDGQITDQGQAIDVINSIAASFRAAVIYNAGKITLSADMPDELPVAVFNEANIKAGSVQMRGIKESQILTGAEISYVDPSNHFKRETVRIDSIDSNDGTDRNAIENVKTMDLFGVTRRSQALRFGQYQIASSRFLRRQIEFITSQDAVVLMPGDVISVQQKNLGVNFGFGGKVSTTSNTSIANVQLEHFTQPAISSTTFTANSKPLALRVIKQDSDRIDLYILSNTLFTGSSTDNVSTGFDQIEVRVIQRFNPITKAFENYSAFTANNIPSKGDLWTFGEVENPGNFYTTKSDKLFKITEMGKTEDEEISIRAVEYVSNVYVDSDTFIDYQPTAYTDTLSPITAPPPPIFDIQANPRRGTDGTVAIDLLLNQTTDSTNYGITQSTEFFVSFPESTHLISNVTATTPYSVIVDNASQLSNGVSAGLIGKNGFQSVVGEIKLLCNSVTAVDSSSNLNLLLEGHNVAFDENFFKHVLDVNDASFAGLKGDDFVTVPVTEKADDGGLRNFVAFNPTEVEISANVKFNDHPNNIIKIENQTNEGTALLDRLPPTPFFVKIFQMQDARFYANNSFYVGGSEFTFTQTNTDLTTTTSHVEPLQIKPRDRKFVRVFIDGKQTDAFSFTQNKGSASPATIGVDIAATDSQLRVEIDQSTVPAIEVGDNVLMSTDNIFAVTGTSYDPESPTSNNELTQNNIFRIKLASAPTDNLTSSTLTNITPNPTGVINNVNQTANTATFDYNTGTFPGNFRLSNNRIYELSVGGDFELLPSSSSSQRIIPNIATGSVVVRARNKNVTGRTSPTVTKSLTVNNIPISKVEELTITEGLYREQVGGVAVRAIITFKHIVGQEVTDYELSYRVTGSGSSDLTSFSTMKLPSNLVDDEGNITYVINNIDRGLVKGIATLDVRVTPLNKDIRGITATASKEILGKTAAPDNVFNLSGSQQIDQITLQWNYVRVNEELKDLDLKEVIIKRGVGTQEANLTNFVTADDFVTVSAGTERKSIPIDIFGTFTYLARTRDTSGNFSESVTATTITTARSQQREVVLAFNEDTPGSDFAGITNSNSTEFNYPSFANSNTGGVSIPSMPSSLVDNANGTSSGFPATGSASDIAAADDATYITQVRDVGTLGVAAIQVDIEGTQGTTTTFNVLKTDILEGTSEVIAGAPANVFTETAFGGIGTVLGFANTTFPSGDTFNVTFDANNKTLIDDSTDQNVYAIFNPGQHADDPSNANSFALIAGTINATAIELGESFFANGEPTGGNGFANVTGVASTYKLVNLTQFRDFGDSETFEGTLGSLTQQTFVRTSSVANPFFANGNVNVAAFDSSETNEGFTLYEAGTRTFRHFQIKFQVDNINPEQFDFTLDKFRYTIEKDKTTFTDEVVYAAQPTTIDYSGAGFLRNPVISLSVVDSQNANAVPNAVVVERSPSSCKINVFFSSNNALHPVDSDRCNVFITAVGV